VAAPDLDDLAGLNREPRSVLIGILNFVGAPRQPCILFFWVSQGKLPPVRLASVRYHSLNPMKQKNDENALVARIEHKFVSTKTKVLPLAFADDAALWSPSAGHDAVLTCDWFLEGSHFLRDKHPPEAVGWKCLARAVSDVAAMGGKPRCFLLSLALPDNLTGKWLNAFLRGLRRASRTLRCEIAGGDTTRHDKVLISITVIGEVRRQRAILRSGAKPGDAIYVSGILGEGELGLRQFRGRRGFARVTDAAVRKHLYPEPRLALGQWLAENRLATAMMDLSDGLSTDLPRLCAASRVGARVDANSLPVTGLASGAVARELALHGGDDYELLFTVKAGNEARLPRKFRGLALTRIGEITRGKKILLNADGRTGALRPGGWDPFRKP
jgi:thiamine-monophosphate kinase